MKLISCEIHDYVEIACLFGYEIKLTLAQGPAVRGRALTTETSPDKREWLLLDNQGTIEKVELSEITGMTAVTPNPHFVTVDFPTLN
mgnify:FL=1